MSINNFKRLEDDSSGRGPVSAPPNVERGVRGNIRFIEFIGHIVELYLPKVFQVFTSMTGAPGEVNHINDDDDKNDTNTPGQIDDATPDDDDTPGHGPGGSMTDDTFH